MSDANRDAYQGHARCARACLRTGGSAGHAGQAHERSEQHLGIINYQLAIINCAPERSEQGVRIQNSKSMNSKFGRRPQRGALNNPNNRFDAHQKVVIPELEDRRLNAEEEKLDNKTKYVLTHPKTILNKITSPDVPGTWGLNPYQGCEHGCTYCFARPTHNYWGYSAGQDFEKVILIKRNTVQLLEAAFAKTSWQASPIMMSGNTDCYQPIERVEKLTRGVLELCWKYRHPIALITKNRLILRDTNLLAKLAKENLVHVAVSVTTLDETLRRKLEPRTASAPQKIEVIKRLSEAGIPVRLMIAPIIPGLTDHEIPAIAKAACTAGARSISYTIVRLNGDVAEVFRDWAHTHYPDRADRILNRIKECHGGSMSDSRFGIRQRGEGVYAETIASQIKLARNRYLPELNAEGRGVLPEFNTALFEEYRPGQRKLF
jgi:DNA repair photolyase